MQQLNTILLATSAPTNQNTSKSGASANQYAGQNLRQDTHQQGFSAALASANSASSLEKKASYLHDNRQPTRTNEPQGDTPEAAEDEVQLIFAQIGMAQEMHNLAARGETLPLGAGMVAGNGASMLGESLDAELLASELANGAQAAADCLDTDLLDTDLLNTDQLELAHVDTALSGSESNYTDLVSAALSSQQMDAQQALMVGTELDSPQILEELMQLSAGSVAGASQDELSLHERSLYDLSQAADGQDDAHAAVLSRAPGTILAAEGTHCETDGQDVATITAATHAAVNKAANPLAQGTILGAAEQDNGAAPLEADSGKMAEQSVKDASLAALDPRQASDPRQGIDIRQDDVVTTWLDEQTDSALEYKSSDFKPLSASHSANAQATSLRPELPLIPISLRQGGGQTPMQEMIQRFSPLMQQQMIAMVSQGLQQAEIRLDPPELGHMLVKIQVQGDQTQVQFQVTQSQTRELVEQAMPRLRELLLEQGMQLADSHVSQGDQGQRREGGFANSQEPNVSNLDDFSAEELDLGLNQSISLTSGIDYYA
ncbi:flagellar hook-length control protein FliK [Shewanella sp.]|uniref:flagellar hook-length control protein FliK n=1 Tax=Shewanella sp. TaxID=50422 RepID=UPI003F3CB8A2